MKALGIFVACVVEVLACISNAVFVAVDTIVVRWWSKLL